MDTLKRIFVIVAITLVATPIALVIISGINSLWAVQNKNIAEIKDFGHSYDDVLTIFVDEQGQYFVDIEYGNDYTRTTFCKTNTTIVKMDIDQPYAKGKFNIFDKQMTVDNQLYTLYVPENTEIIKMDY